MYNLKWLTWCNKQHKYVKLCDCFNKTQWDIKEIHTTTVFSVGTVNTDILKPQSSSSTASSFLPWLGVSSPVSTWMDVLKFLQEFLRETESVLLTVWTQRSYHDRTESRRAEDPLTYPGPVFIKALTITHCKSHCRSEMLLLKHVIYNVMWTLTNENDSSNLGSIKHNMDTVRSRF